MRLSVPFLFKPPHVPHGGSQAELPQSSYLLVLSNTSHGRIEVKFPESSLQDGHYLGDMVLQRLLRNQE